MSRINYGGGSVRALIAPLFFDAGYADGEGYGHGSGAGDGLGHGRLQSDGSYGDINGNERDRINRFMRGA